MSASKRIHSAAQESSGAVNCSVTIGHLTVHASRNFGHRGVYWLIFDSAASFEILEECSATHWCPEEGASFETAGTALQHQSSPSYEYAAVAAGNHIQTCVVPLHPLSSTRALSAVDACKPG